MSHADASNETVMGTFVRVGAHRNHWRHGHPTCELIVPPRDAAPVQTANSSAKKVDCSEPTIVTTPRGSHDCFRYYSFARRQWRLER